MLVSNVETLANLALISRHGAGWFRSAGTASAPGSALVTVSGAARRPGVYEIAFGTPVRDVLALAGGGGEIGGVQAVLAAATSELAARRGRARNPAAPDALLAAGASLARASSSSCPPKAAGSPRRRGWSATWRAGRRAVRPVPEWSPGHRGRA